MKNLNIISETCSEDYRAKADAIRAILRGESPEAMAQRVGVHRSTIYRWLQAYEESGWSGLKGKGLIGRPSKINDDLRTSILDLIGTYSPDRFNMEKRLWDTESFNDVVRHYFNLKLSKPTRWRLMRSLGIRQADLFHRLGTLSREERKLWEDRELEPVRKFLKGRNGELLYLVETPICSRYQKQLGELNMISVENGRKEIRFLLYKNGTTVEDYIDFCSRLLSSTSRSLVLVGDGHPNQKTKEFAEFEASHRSRLRVLSLKVSSQRYAEAS